MPELPEVETVVRTLEHQLKDAEIAQVRVIYPKLVDNMTPQEFENKLKGQHFRTFSRRGKYLIFELDDYVLVSHLRMEGKFYVEPDLKVKDKHTHLIITLTDSRYVMYHDVRKFGRMQLYVKGSQLTVLNKLGLEPFDKKLNIAYLKEKCPPHHELKEILLDQSIIAGIGNIYANEICFAMKVLPDKQFEQLSDKQLQSLIDSTRTILSAAIKDGGTTIRSYTSSLGVNGKFQQHLMVHGQKECKVCGSQIKKVYLKGRGTYYCPKCQK